MAAFFGSILFLILFVILFILVMGLSLLARLVGGVRNLWNIFTGKGINWGDRQRSNTRNSTNNSNTTYEESTTSSNQGDRPHSKGVFGDDEGTYVEFEEVKE